MAFPIVTYQGENWTIKKPEHQRTDGFKLQCFQKTLLSPLGSKEIKPINPKGNQGEEMVRKNHQLNGHEFEQSSGDLKDRASLQTACCSPWGCKDSDMP